MPNEIFILCWTAATIGFVHTLFGPDHYLPFIVLSKARGWNMGRTFLITFICGLGHILSSVVLGLIGVIFGVAIFKIKAIEFSRGEIASWLLIAFGLGYFIWGVYKAIRWKPHCHIHPHEDGKKHIHAHGHGDGHLHLHFYKEANLTFWTLFIIFIFGPCELLIPLIIYPAAQHNILAVILVTSIFGLATICTMMIIVLASFYGLSKLPVEKLERYSHALAGFIIFLCGGAIKFLGL